MINYNKVARFANLKYECLHFYSKNKLKIFVLGFIIILFLLTGIFTALKITDLEKALKLVEFSFESLVDGGVYTFSFFVKRFASVLLVMALLFLFASNKFASILGYLLIGYRAFLLTLNCVLIVMYMGIGGAINAIVIILPCQLLQILLMSLMFVIICAVFKERQQCGSLNFGNVAKVLLVVLTISLLLNVIELFLLLIFKATSILII